MPILRAMKLYEQPDAVLIVSSDPTIKEALRIIRASGAIEECEKPASLRGSSLVIFGIVGFIELNAGMHLVVITASAKVGRLLNKDIFTIKATQIISLAPASVQVSPQQLTDDAQYRAMLQEVLKNPFYFSYDFDVTNTAQRRHERPGNDAPLYQQVDRRFFWNEYLSTPLRNILANNWILPVMMGYIEIQSNITLSGKKFDFALITRRSINRAGMRYVVRGIDEGGNVANYNETEQLLISDGTVASFVQTRGSIPVFWEQKVDLKYKPRPTLVRTPAEALPYTRAHFEEQVRIYGSQVAVNLVDQKGAELVLAQAYSEQVTSLSRPDVRYVPFDFHTECKSMKYENISKLIKQIEADLQEHSFFWQDKDGKVTKRQTGVVRTNCVDNLDRSNVVQSVIARHVLRSILSEFSVGENTDFEQRFKNVWANNADAVSMQYTGTGALKTDYTRTGKRSISGVISDARNSASRYYLNNFSDGFRQDSFDLFLGNFRVDPSISPFAVPSKNLPSVMGFAIIALVLAFLLAAFELLPISGFLVVLAWALGMAAFLKLAVASGTEWVDRPKLVANH